MSFSFEILSLSNPSLWGSVNTALEQHWAQHLITDPIDSTPC